MGIQVEDPVFGGGGGYGVGGLLSIPTRFGIKFIIGGVLVLGRGNCPLIDLPHLLSSARGIKEEFAVLERGGSGRIAVIDRDVSGEETDPGEIVGGIDRDRELVEKRIGAVDLEEVF